MGIAAGVTIAGLLVSLLRESGILLLPFLNVEGLTPGHINDLWPLTWRLVWIAAGLLAAFAVLGRRYIPSRVLSFVLLAITLSQTYLIMRGGSWLETKGPTPSYADIEANNHLPLFAGNSMLATNELAEDSWGYATVDYTTFRNAAGEFADCYLPVSGNHAKSLSTLPFYFSSNIESVVSSDALLEKLRHSDQCPRRAGTAFVEGQPRVALPFSSLYDQNVGTHVVSVSPNGVRVLLRADRAGLFVTPYPWAKGKWRTTVDDQKVSPILVNGAFVGVPVGEGQHSLSIFFASDRLKRGYLIFLVTVTVLFAGLMIKGGSQLKTGQKLDWQFSGILAVILVGLIAAGAKWNFNYWKRVQSDVHLNENFSELLGNLQRDSK